MKEWPYNRVDSLHYLTTSFPRPQDPTFEVKSQSCRVLIWQKCLECTECTEIRLAVHETKT